MAGKRGNLLLWLVIGGGALLFFTVSLIALAVFVSEEEAPAFSLAHNQLALLELEGIILDSKEFTDQLKAFGKRSPVRAVVLRLNTPGGGVAASQEIYAGLRRYRAETGRPVVASFGGVAASGGYYVACAADRIVANPGSLTGSIGVILTFPNAEGLLDRIGIRFRSIKSGPMKDQGAYWRDLTEDERIVLQSMVDDVYEQFIDAVEDGRRISREEILPLADGRALSGRQALEAGLVDTLGDLTLALDVARRLGGLRGDSPIVRPPEKRERLLDWLQRSSSRLPGIVQPAMSLEYRLSPPLLGGVVGQPTR